MSENKALTTTAPDAPAEWRGREEVTALARRLQAMLPGDLDPDAALTLAQYSAAMDANPFRGEIYAFKRGGRIVLVDGYKLLVRWARRRCNFSDRYEKMAADELPKGAIGYRCQVLRDDAGPTLQSLVGAGASWDQAFAIAAQSAEGIVTSDDRTNKRGQPIPPPKGWTWEQVARKRALKNALNLAYGAPSPREIARESWMVEDTETLPEDWPDDDGMLSIEREITAAYNAKQRERPQSELTASEAASELFDDLYDNPGEAIDDDEPFICQDCSRPLADFQANGKTWTVSELVDIGQNLKDGGVLCGDCLKARKEATVVN